jgi:hypothetical protein
VTPDDPDLARAFETTWPAAEYRRCGRLSRRARAGRRRAGQFGPRDAAGLGRGRHRRRRGHPSGWGQRRYVPPARQRQRPCRCADAARLSGRESDRRSWWRIATALADRAVPGMTAFAHLAALGDSGRHLGGRQYRRRPAGGDAAGRPAARPRSLAACEDRAAGAAFVAADGPVAMIHAIEVLPAFRRRGLAAGCSAGRRYGRNRRAPRVWGWRSAAPIAARGRFTTAWAFQRGRRLSLLGPGLGRSDTGNAMGCGTAPNPRASRRSSFFSRSSSLRISSNSARRSSSSISPAISVRCPAARRRVPRAATPSGAADPRAAERSAPRPTAARPEWRWRCASARALGGGAGLGDAAPGMHQQQPAGGVARCTMPCQMPPRRPSDSNSLIGACPESEFRPQMPRQEQFVDFDRAHAGRFKDQVQPDLFQPPLIHFGIGQIEFDHLPAAQAGLEL